MTRLRAGLPAALLLAALAGCGRPPKPTQIVHDAGTVAYVDESQELPRLRYADGQVSVNDRCIIRQGKLNPRMPPIYVNGRPIGFC